MAKAGRPRKGSTGLPAWFDIQKYRTVKTFTTENWFQQLAFRKSLFDYEIRSKEKTYKGFGAGLSKALDLLQTDPFITVDRIHKVPLLDIKGSDGKIRLQIVDPAIYEGVRAMWVGTLGIRDAINWEIVWAYQTFPSCIKKYVDCQGNTFIEDDKTVLNEQDFLLASYEEDTKTLIAVDLLMPDNVLMAEFASYLKNKRKKLGKHTNPFVKNTDFRNWYNYGVLPYLDLQLWELVTGEPIRWSAFADALTKITDKPIGSESALSKTTKSYAARLMNESTLRALQSQVIREHSGELKKSGKLVVR